jgi:predicted AlkP superfamily phosphohydrolase/phosphomutase
MSARRIVLLGIDAASPALLREWALAGALPNLAALFARGLSGETRSLPGYFIGSTWPSFYTGTSPARHGFHYQVQLRPGSYELFRPEHGQLVQVPPFWHYLSEAGKRVAVLDVPLTQLAPQINGVQTVEWGGHDALYGFQANPPELADSIRARFGTHPVGSTCDAVRTSAADYRAFIDQLVRGVEQKTRITRQVLAQERWDFFAQIFTETHCVGHQCWHLHDPTHPGHDPAVALGLGNPLRTVYAAVDRAIGEIVAEAGDALVLVLSAHGMTSFFGAQLLMREILLRLGVMSALPAPVQSEPGWRVAAGAVWRMLPDALRARLAPIRAMATERRLESDEVPRLGIDPARSQCFPLSNGLGSGGIRLNLAGREPGGILQPGDQAKAFVAQLTQDLLDIRDAAGVRLVSRVLETRALYDGHQLDALPDLVVEWNDEIALGSHHVAQGRGARAVAQSAKLGRLERENTFARTGEHRIEGLFVAAGAGVPNAHLDRPVSVLDFAPTFCELLGVTLPVTDGTPIAALVRASGASTDRADPAP